MTVVAAQSSPLLVHRTLASVTRALMPMKRGRVVIRGRAGAATFAASLGVTARRRADTALTLVWVGKNNTL